MATPWQPSVDELTTYYNRFHGIILPQCSRFYGDFQQPLEQCYAAHYRLTETIMNLQLRIDDYIGTNEQQHEKKAYLLKVIHGEMCKLDVVLQIRQKEAALRKSRIYELGACHDIFQENILPLCSKFYKKNFIGAESREGRNSTHFNLTEMITALQNELDNRFSDDTKTKEKKQSLQDNITKELKALDAHIDSNWETE